LQPILAAPGDCGAEGGPAGLRGSSGALDGGSGGAQAVIYAVGMTPNEMNVLKSLVVVAWADGHVAAPEKSVIEGLLGAFDANEAEEREVLDFASQRRTLLADIPLEALDREDRELLLANAALLTHADGVQTASEKAILDKLVKMLDLGPAAAAIIEGAKDGALELGSKVLDDVE